MKAKVKQSKRGETGRKNHFPLFGLGLRGNGYGKIISTLFSFPFKWASGQQKLFFVKRSIPTNVPIFGALSFFYPQN